MSRRHSSGALRSRLLEKSPADACGGNSNSEPCPNGCGEPEHQIFTPEVGPTGNWGPCCSPCGNGTNGRPKDRGDEDCSGVCAGVCDGCTHHEKAWRGDDGPYQSGDRTLPASAQHHDE